MDILTGMPIPFAARRHVLRALLLGSMLFFLGGAQPGLAQSGSESQIKAAFLYKFGDFVDWPPSAFARADGPLVIGVLGADEVFEELERVTAGRTIAGRPAEIRKLRRGDRVYGLHLLFIGGQESARALEHLTAVKGQPVLTVTDSESASAHGSVINFVVVDGKVRFDVALAPAEHSRLRISSRLLAVARKVAAPS
jgi:hypothetical protein